MIVLLSRGHLESIGDIESKTLVLVSAAIMSWPNIITRTDGDNCICELCRVLIMSVCVGHTVAKTFYISSHETNFVKSIHLLVFNKWDNLSRISNIRCNDIFNRTKLSFTFPWWITSRHGSVLWLFWWNWWKHLKSQRKTLQWTSAVAINNSLNSREYIHNVVAPALYYPCLVGTWQGRYR